MRFFLRLSWRSWSGSRWFMWIAALVLQFNFSKKFCVRSAGAGRKLNRVNGCAVYLFRPWIIHWQYWIMSLRRRWGVGRENLTSNIEKKLKRWYLLMPIICQCRALRYDDDELRRAGESYDSLWGKIVAPHIWAETAKDVSGQRERGESFLGELFIGSLPTRIYC